MTSSNSWSSRISQMGVRHFGQRGVCRHHSRRHAWQKWCEHEPTAAFVIGHRQMGHSNIRQPLSLSLSLSVSVKALFCLFNVPATLGDSVPNFKVDGSRDLIHAPNLRHLLGSPIQQKVHFSRNFFVGRARASHSRASGCVPKAAAARVSCVCVCGRPPRRLDRSGFSAARTHSHSRARACACVCAATSKTNALPARSARAHGTCVTAGHQSGGPIRSGWGPSAAG